MFVCVLSYLLWSLPVDPMNWSTLVPGYIFGLSRPRERGAVSLGFGAGYGEFAFMATECTELEWLEHDGVSFGRERVVMDDIGSAEIHWVNTDENIFFQVSSPKLPDLLLLVLEEFQFVNITSDHTIRFSNGWELASSAPWYGVSGSGNHYWENPAKAAFDSADWDKSIENEFFYPLTNKLPLKGTFILFIRIGYLSVVTFSIHKEHVINEVLFPMQLYEERLAEWKKESALSLWGMRALSNLLGNLAHYNGTLITKGYKRPLMSLLSIQPSRTKFPRPFLWDEGFHLLAIYEYRPRIALSILVGWLETQDESGWIPRELALSLRDRWSIPDRFLQQDPMVANPTSLVFVIRRMMPRMDGDMKFYFFQKLSKWLAHLMKTQASDTQGCFRWKQRTVDHCFASGLDDYPRSPRVITSECHLDLHVWLILLARTVTDLCQTDCLSHENLGKKLVGNLKIFAISKSFMADLVFAEIHSTHIGYVSLIPFALGSICLDDIESISHILVDVIPKLLGPVGLLSLSAEDKFYQTGESYWRGNVWGNINLLVVGALFGYATYMPREIGEYMRFVGEEIRTRWTSGMRAAWEKAGGPVEYMHPAGGGGGVYPFAGWTAAAMLLLDKPDQSWWNEAVSVMDCPNPENPNP